MYSAVKTAKAFAATHAVKLTDKQFAAFKKALSLLLVEAYNAGFQEANEQKKEINLNA
jgi:hypothetical protein